MIHRAVLHLRTDQDLVATLYAHDAGSPARMLPRIAAFLTEEPAGDLGRFLAHTLNDAEERLVLVPAGNEPGDIDHRWTLSGTINSVKAQRLILTCEAIHVNTDNETIADSTVVYTGNREILNGAISALRDTAADFECEVKATVSGPITQAFAQEVAAMHAKADSLFVDLLALTSEDAEQ